MSLTIRTEDTNSSSAIVVRPDAEVTPAPLPVDAPSFTHTHFSLERHAAAVTALAFLNDASFLLTASADRSALLWDLNAEELPAVLALRGSRAALTSLAVHESRVAASLACADGEIAVHDLANGSRVARIRAHKARTPVNDVASCGEHQLLSAGNDRNVRLWDLRAKSAPKAQVSHSAPVLALCTLDEHHFIAAGLDGVLYMHDLRKVDASPEVLAQHTGHVTGVAASQHSSFVASIAADNGCVTDARPYVGKRGRHVATLKGSRVAFEPNLIRPAWAGDKCVAAGGADGIVTLWDARSGGVLALHEARAGAVNAVAFHAHLSVLASAADDGTVHIGPSGVDLTTL